MDGGSGSLFRVCGSSGVHTHFSTTHDGGMYLLCVPEESVGELIMRNDECIVKFLNKDGRVVQSFQRDKDGWFETSSKGIVRRCTAEQTLSHLLPPVAGVSRAIVKVERI